MKRLQGMAEELSHSEKESNLRKMAVCSATTGQRGKV